MYFLPFCSGQQGAPLAVEYFVLCRLHFRSLAEIVLKCPAKRTGVSQLSLSFSLTFNRILTVLYYFRAEH